MECEESHGLDGVAISDSMLQVIYRKSALETIRQLCFALNLAESDNLNDLVEHMVSIRHLSAALDRELSALSVLKAHGL